MDIQDIFNRVIDAGYYSEERCTFMCGALAIAEAAGIITHVEHHQTCSDIYEYLDNVPFLSFYLKRYGIDNTFNDRLAIYRDWANRPIFVKDAVVQDVFDRVIEAGHYREEVTTTTSPYMCIALIHALKNEIITEDEYQATRTEIKMYLQGKTTLEKRLTEFDIKGDFLVRLRIYQRWTRRPVTYVLEP